MIDAIYNIAWQHVLVQQVIISNMASKIGFSVYAIKILNNDNSQFINDLALLLWTCLCTGTLCWSTVEIGNCV